MQTLSNKTFDITSTIAVTDNLLVIADDGDTTKKFKFQASGITTATTRTLTIPNADTTLVGDNTTQTLTNKTLTSPTISNATITNPTLTVDSISGFSSASTVAVAGLTITSGVLVTANSVVTTNITADAVTDAKLIYGKLRSRQGGSASNWYTAGTTTYDYSGTNVFMQCGVKANNASPTTTTFPTAFANVPLVVVTVTTASGANCYAVVSSVTTTTFVCQVVTDAGVANTAQNISWIAIGE